MTGKELDGRKSAQGARKEGGLRGHIAAIVALFALAIVAVAWFWLTRKPPQEAGLLTGLGTEHGIIVVGAGAFVIALVAYVRNMDFMDVVEMLAELVMGLFALIGVILKGIWSTILGILGWD